MGQILKSPGTEADIGEVIAHLTEGAGAASAPAPKVEPAAPKMAPPAPEPSSPSPSPAQTQAEAEEGPIASPAAKRLLEENKLTTADVAGSGKDGRILKEDVLGHLEDGAPNGPGVSNRAQEDSERQRVAPVSTVVPQSPVAKAAPPSDGSEAEEVVPMSPLRRKIAETLVSAQQTAAILTTFNEVDMTAVIALRKQYQEQFVKKHGIKLGFMSFFIKAAVESLKAYPAVNSEIRGTSFVYKNHYDIGVAVGTEKGLVVPVLRGADSLSLSGIENGIKELAGKARNMKLTLADLQGGTFTISNGGIYGSMMSTPILNPPQSGILGLHNITERPVAVDGKVEIRPMMYLALSYDHRVVDGKGAVSFLVSLKNAIEDPARLLLEI